MAMPERQKEKERRRGQSSTKNQAKNSKGRGWWCKPFTSLSIYRPFVLPSGHYSCFVIRCTKIRLVEKVSPGGALKKVARSEFSST